jgi:hypothetical protein
MGDQNKHFPFSASGAERWFNCPGSWKLEKMAPVDTSGNDASRLGTAVHAMIEDCMRWDLKHPASVLLGGRALLDTNGDFVRFLGDAEIDSNGYIIPVTEEMCDSAQVCLDLVAKILEKHPDAVANGTVFSELKTVIIPDTLGGTADIVIVDGDWACIIDYKNGTNHVDVEYNLQLQIYALGVMENIKAAEHVERWTLCIVQPNDYSDPQKIRTWKTTTAALDGLSNVIKGSISACESDNPETVPGKWCKWCKANNCPAKNKALLKAAQVELDDLPAVGSQPVAPAVLPENLTNEQLAWVLDNSAMIKKHIERIEAEALSRMQRGDAIPGYKLVEARTRRKVVDVEGLEAAAEANDWDVWERKIAPLKQLDKQVPKAELAKYVQKPAGAPTWAPESDKRPAIGNLLAGIDEIKE